MGLLEWLLAIGGLALTVLAWGVFVSRGNAGPRMPSAGDAEVRLIRVNEGYQPSELHVAAGRPVRLLFRREETAPCSERVVFPDYGISVGLPPFEDVAVDLPASEPGAHRFCCGMEMLHGNIIVEPDGAARAVAGTREAVAA